MDTRPIGPKPKPTRPGGPKPRPGKPKPRPLPLPKPGKPGRPGIGKPKPKPDKIVNRKIGGLKPLGLGGITDPDRSRNKTKNQKTGIGYAITGIQNRLKGGKKGPGKVGKMAR